ncbi:mitotic fidelity of chromosome transmission- protein [Coemansia nantahalensis]|uniref:Mitotic fidelity of chromosome transmission-protein n=1 Tax=Coemansia nantahalensis TaxID=2789366 RepID=A0ACC1K8F8_9FUNG|nr:mitotic fidelity of chromosome transmission- protein [Coemansia nantahalensis]KAJ2775562.1 mitotic fidelity of chromosome transmission- protein [Coemansia nantahalensis]
MSSRAVRRAKSPATRNKFNDIGVTGRKTGVRVAGAVRVDEDGLENVDEFYKQTTPQDKDERTKRAKQPTQTLHTLLSPTPVRSASNYESLVGALDMPDDADGLAKEDEIAMLPLVRPHRPLVDQSPSIQAGARAAARRTTMVPSRLAPPDEGWVRSPKRGRRVTMAFTAQRRNLADSEEAAEAAAEESAEESAEEAADEDEHMADDPGEITSATAIEGEDTRDADDVSATDENDDESVNVFAAGAADDEVSDEADEADDNDAAAESETGSDAEPQHEVPEGGDDDDDDDHNLRLDEPDEDVEDDAAATDEDDIGGEEDVEERPPSAKKQQSTAKRGPRKAQQTEQAPRRSARASVQPLAFWRNEHIEYEYARGDGSGVAMPKMKNVVRVRHTSEEKNHAKKRRVKLGARPLPSLRGIKVGELDLNDRNRFYYYDDENFGFPVEDDKSSKFGPKPAAPSKPAERATARGSKRSVDQFDDNDDIEVDSGTQLVVEADGVSEFTHLVAISRSEIEWAAKSSGDKYKSGLGLINEEADGAPAANSGVLCIAVGGKKPLRSSSDKTTFYLVTSGKVEVRLHQSTFHVGALGQFLVPQHNAYSITNVGTHPAQIYFVQMASAPVAAAPADGDDDDDDDDE